MLILIGLEGKGLVDFQGRRGITSVVRWSLRPVILGVDYCLRQDGVIYTGQWAGSMRLLLDGLEGTSERGHLVGIASNVSNTIATNTLTGQQIILTDWN